MACGQKSVKNLKENLTKIINKQVLLSKSLICIKIRQIRSIRVQEEETNTNLTNRTNGWIWGRFARNYTEGPSKSPLRGTY